MASISDFTWRLYRNCTKRAPELSTEVNDIYTVLHILDDEMSSQFSFFSDLGPQKAEYTSILGECVADLQELESLIRHRPKIARHGESSRKNSIASLLESLRPRLRKHARAFNTLMEKLDMANEEDDDIRDTHRSVRSHNLPSRTSNILLSPESRRAQLDRETARSHQPYVETVVESEDDTIFESEAEQVSNSVPLTSARPNTPAGHTSLTSGPVGEPTPSTIPESSQRPRQRRRRGSSASAGISRADFSRLRQTNGGGREPNRIHTSRPTEENCVSVTVGPDGEGYSEDEYEMEPRPEERDRFSRAYRDSTRTNRQNQPRSSKRGGSPSSWSSAAVSGRQAQVPPEERSVRRTKKKDPSVQELKDEIDRIEQQGRRVHFQDQINHANGPGPAYPLNSSPQPVLGATPYFATPPYMQPQYGQQPIHPAFANFQQYTSPPHFTAFPPQQPLFGPAAAPWYQSSPAPPPYAQPFGPFSPPPPVTGFHAAQPPPTQAATAAAESKATTKKSKKNELIGPLLVDGNGVCHYSNCVCAICV